MRAQQRSVGHYVTMNIEKHLRIRIRTLAASAALVVQLLVVPGVHAQVSPEDLRLPISLDADSTDYDGKSSMLMFRGLRLTQGNIGVQADIGRATKLDFEDSVWRFSGNVIIDTENGHIECETADLRFSNHQLQLATITGSPATFEMQRPESADTTYAEAGKLDYDFASGVVEFSENATITEGGNQISSSYLVYNIAEQRINAQSTGQDGERVKITYTPKPPEGETVDPDQGEEPPPAEPPEAGPETEDHLVPDDGDTAL